MYRTPDMGLIYDGFFPTSRGGAVMAVDVPTIQLPTMHEMQVEKMMVLKSGELM